jgi:hypothetical protein
MIYLTPYLRNLAKTNWETLKEQNKENKEFKDFVETLTTTCLNEKRTPLGTKLYAILENIFVNEHKIHGDNDVTKCTADLIKTLDQGGNTTKIENVEDGYHDIVAAFALMLYFCNIGIDFSIINMGYPDDGKFTIEIVNNNLKSDSEFGKELIPRLNRLTDSNNNKLLKRLVHKTITSEILNFDKNQPPKFMIHNFFHHYIKKKIVYEELLHAISIDNVNYLLVSAGIIISFKNKEEDNPDLHAVCGIMCGDVKYIYDSNNVLFRCDWTKKQGIQEYTSHTRKSGFYYENIIEFRRYSYAVYIKDSELKKFNGELSVCL